MVHVQERFLMTNDWGKPQGLSDAVGRAALTIHFINFPPFIDFLARPRSGKVPGHVLHWRLVQLKIVIRNYQIASHLDRHANIKPKLRALLCMLLVHKVLTRGFDQSRKLNKVFAATVWFFWTKLRSLISPYTNIPTSLSIYHMLTAISFLSVLPRVLQSLIPVGVSSLKVSWNSCKTPVTHF